MAACEETGTVVCLHVGSSGTSPATSPDAPSDTIGVLFFGYAMFAAVDWLYSRIPVRFPELRICLSEGGIGWVAGLLDRLEHVRKYDAMYGTWNDVALSPADTFRRNFWVCAIDDPSAFLQRDVIGIGNILVESDYPHADSTWPVTQERLAAQLAGLSDAEIAPRHLGERVGAVPPPGARRGAAGSECLLSVEVVDTLVGSGASARTTVRSLRFGGVPYARAERWGAPEPSSWTEPFDATRPGAAPPQTVGGLDLVPGMIPTEQTEALSHRRDLHARRSDGSRPVLVWVPGGSYRIGAASLPLYDGAHLAARGVVVVGLNYRWARWAGSPHRACRRTSGCATSRRGRVAARQRRPRSAAIPTASCSWASRPARGASRTCSRPVIFPWRARSCRAARSRARSTPRPRRGWASSSSTPPAPRPSPTSRRRPSTRSSPRRSRPSRRRWPRSA